MMCATGPSKTVRVKRRSRKERQILIKKIEEQRKIKKLEEQFEPQHEREKIFA